MQDLDSIEFYYYFGFKFRTLASKGHAAVAPSVSATVYSRLTNITDVVTGKAADGSVYDRHVTSVTSLGAN